MREKRDLSSACAIRNQRLCAKLNNHDGIASNEC